MKQKRIFSGITAASLVLSMVGQFSVCAAEQVPEKEEKQYIIVAENANVYDAIAEEISESLIVEAPVLEDNNIMVAEMNENEAAELEQNEDVLIEEDIMISASTADGNDEEEMISDAIRRKEQVRLRKEEIFSELEDSNADQDVNYEWNLQAINADEVIMGSAMEEPEGEKVKVAVLDSGIDYVEGIELAGYVNFVDEEEEVPFIFQDLTGHGTGIASIIAGNPEGDILGVNPNAELYSVRVLNSENAAPLSRVIEGIYWCIEHDMDIINMSFGTTIYSRALEQAVEAAYDSGLLMVAAAGNGSGAVEYPAAFDEVMAVASVSPEAEISSFSNTGEELDVAAPGEKVRVSSFFNGSVVTHGTSIAVPHVTGVASLLWEKDLTKSNEFIRQLIDSSAKEIEAVDACGLLDAGYALEIYDDFAETFASAGTPGEINIPENTDEPDIFDEITEDEAYVEGRWSGSDHKGAVDQGSAGFTTEAVSFIKKGVVYPDNGDSGWANGRENPRWHGKWETKYGNELNYIASFELMTSIALEGGNTSVFTDYQDFLGMRQTVFDDLKKDIRDLLNNSAKVNTIFGSKNTAENRKYFIWGCALHNITDMLAHSTTKPDGEIIGHGYNNGTEPDNTSYYPRRYRVAAKITEYSLESLKEGIYSDGDEVVRALNSEYKDKATFKIIKIKKYANDNGYTASVLSQATIANPIIPQ